jgi:hypothetical protein
VVSKKPEFIIVEPNKVISYGFIFLNP